MLDQSIKLYRHFSYFCRSKLAKGSVLLFSGTILSGVLGYIFQILMGRMLDVKEYGLFVAMTALIALLSGPLNTVMTVVSRKVSYYKAEHDYKRIVSLYSSSQFYSLIVWVGFFALYSIFSEEIKNSLQATSKMPVYMLGLLALLTILPIISRGTLQGMQKFNLLAASMWAGGVLRIAFSVTLVWLGFGVAGALGGLIIASFCVWLYMDRRVRKISDRERKLEYELERRIRPKKEIKEIIPVFLSNTAFSVMTQVDVVLVNFYFTQAEVGVYAAASILGKAVLYLPGGIVMALFPLVAENYARLNDSIQILRQSLMMTFTLCGAGALIYFFLGSKVIIYLYGDEYKQAGELLTMFGFAVLPMTLIMVVERYLLAQGRMYFGYIFIFIVPFLILAVHYNHDSLNSIVWILGGFGFMMAIIGFAMLWREIVIGKPKTGK